MAVRLVLVCEPTSRSFARPERNISANPQLARRIRARQVMLLAREDAALPEGVMARWTDRSSRNVVALPLDAPCRPG